MIVPKVGLNDAIVTSSAAGVKDDMIAAQALVTSAAINCLLFITQAVRCMAPTFMSRLHATSKGIWLQEVLTP